MKVCKFGGVAMATADSVKRVAEILDSDAERRIAVVSAIGRRYREDKKVTDILYDCIRSDERKERLTLLEEVFDRYYALYSDLYVDFDLSPLFEEYANKLCEGFENEEIICLGEFLSAILFSKYLDWEIIDPKQCILFCEGRVDYQNSIKLVNEVFKKVDKAVVAGFYGADVFGRTRILSRGGSDVSGAIIARGINAELYENWTDVNGYYCVDPNIVDNPKHIDYLSYDELYELSLSGAGTLHYDSIIPLKGKIPILIKSVFAPWEEGTLVSEQRGKPRYIAVKRNLVRLTINTDIKCLYMLSSFFEAIKGSIERLLTTMGALRIYLLQIDEALIKLIEKYKIPYSIDYLSVITVGGIKEDRITLMKELEKMLFYDLSVDDKGITFSLKNDILEETIRNIYKVL